MFFTLNPEAGEADHDFVLRVEQQRCSLCLPANTVYHAFVHKLHLQLKGELDQVCHSRKANRQGFDWGEVVEIYKNHALGPPIAPSSPTATLPTGLPHQQKSRKRLSPQVASWGVILPVCCYCQAIRLGARFSGKSILLLPRSRAPSLSLSPD